MQPLQTNYTVYFNRRHGHSGHVFEQRYKAFLVDRDNHLLQVSRYLHLNPVAAKLVKKPQDYRWSSYRGVFSFTDRLQGCFSKVEGKDPRNLRKLFNWLLVKAELRRIRFHDIRHTFATLLIEQGESLAYVKEQLGHSSIQITVDTYGHLVPGGNRQAVDKLDDATPAGSDHPK